MAISEPVRAKLGVKKRIFISEYLDRIRCPMNVNLTVGRLLKIAEWLAVKEPA
jgi:hypothetical protein